MSKPRRTSYAVTSAELPVLKTLGLEEVDPEEVFELQRKEGAGAFGRVFRACYKQDRNRLAALKVIPVALEAGERGEDIESVRREIQFLRECDHPNVVAFHGAYYKDGALWVAMEHCAGGSVGDVRRVRSLSEREISIIMRGALHGLAYLHSKRKIHRDVKGGNILLTDSGQVKIADFGVSAQLRDTLSRRGSFVGTPYWMSPELIQDSDYDFKADIWSLGITAIELADQKPPLFDEHPMRVLIQIPRNPPPQVAQPENWSTAFIDFLRFCLRKNPAERPTALECMQHEFIRREAHIERVFASGGEDGEDVKEENDTRSEAEVVPASASTIEQQFDEEIAEDIDENTRLSEASISSSSDEEDEVEASTGLLGETFEFRESAVSFTAVLTPKLIGSADELLNLSINESFALDDNLPALSEVTKLHIDQETHSQPTNQPFSTISTTLSVRQPATELKLLPSSVKSPVLRGFSSRESFTHFVKITDPSKPATGTITLLSSQSDSKKSLRPSPALSLGPKQSSSPPSSPSVTSSWLSISSSHDPLTSIDTVTNARVNRLLSSYSTSTSPSLAAAMRAYNDQYTTDPSMQNSTRQSFNWRSEAALPSTSNRDERRLSSKIFVGDPFRASHDMCVKYNSIQAQYEGAPMSAEWAALHQQFGIALAHMRCQSAPQSANINDQVPALVRMLRRELIRHGGLSCKYIYRVSPVQEDVQHAKAAINRGSFEPAQTVDPHVYGSLLKLWLRELPHLLLDALDVQDLENVIKLTNIGKINEKDDENQLFTSVNGDIVDTQVTKTLQKLGVRENSVFQWLLEHMLEVSTHRSSNLMTTQALATVMAPNLFSCFGAARTSQENAGNLMRQVVTFLCVVLSWKRFSLGKSPGCLLEPGEKNFAAAFSTTTEAATNGKVSGLQERVRQSLTKLKSSELNPEGECLENVSLETVLRNRVDRLWSDLENSEVTTVETKHQEHVLRRVFTEFQQSMLQLIAQHSKRNDESLWANDLIDKLKNSQQLETSIPESLMMMKEWLEAALAFEAFCRLLDREQITQDKLEKLPARFGTTRDNLETQSDEFSLTGSVFRHLTRIHHQQKTASTVSDDKNLTFQSNQSDDNITTTEKLLLDGAVRITSRRKRHTNPEDLVKLHHNLAKLGERQAAIGNLLVLLGDRTHNQSRTGTSSLNYLQEKIMETNL